MFSWFKKKAEDRPDAAESPAQPTTDQIAVQRELARILMSVFESAGERLVPHNDWLAHPASGLSIRPHLGSMATNPNGSVSAATVTEIYHPDLAGQPTIYEFQHSAGKDAEAAFRAGFDQWRKLDFVVLTDAFAKDKPKHCTLMKMEFPAEKGRAARTRNILLGPVAHYRQNPIEGEEHPFCTCCLFTNSHAAFKEIIESPGMFAIRFYAARDANGAASADCRVNGKEFEPGKEELRKYVEKWPAAGMEFRKQYVVIHGRPYRETIPADLG